MAFKSRKDTRRQHARKEKKKKKDFMRILCERGIKERKKF